MDSFLFGLPWPTAQFPIGAAGVFLFLAFGFSSDLAAYLATFAGEVVNNVAFVYCFIAVWAFHLFNL